MPYKEKRVEKLYYTIGEVSEILGVPISTVRYWENEFVLLKPKRNKKGNRLFTRDDLDKLKKIQFLLKERGMTIDGARKLLSAKGESGEGDAVLEVSGRLQEIRKMLVELIDSF